MNIDANRALGERLRQLRTAHDLTQAEVADALGKPQSFVSKIESGERSLHLCEVPSYAEALNMAPENMVAQIFSDQINARSI